MRRMLLAYAFLGVAVMAGGLNAAAAQSKDDIRAAQDLLSKEGYDVGSADGVFGRKTEQAIRQYQSDWEIAETGQVTGELLQRLRRTHPDTAPRTQALRDKPGCEVENPRPQPREYIEFSGSCSGGKPSGQGKLTWRYYQQGERRSETREGEFRDSKLNGKGVAVFANGNRYEGEFRDNKRNGNGVAVLADGDRYEGEWRDGERHGKGVYAYADGGRYEGEWRDGERHGKGILVTAGGNRYEGEFRDDKVNGKGIFVWTNGDRYEGEFRENKRNGNGVAVFASGVRYEGEWRDGKPEGRGTRTGVNGERTTGNWRAGCLSTPKTNYAIATTTAACGF